MRSVLASASIAFWRLDLATNVLIGSDRGWALFGLTNRPRSYQEFLAAVHPEDRAHLEEAIQHALADEAEHEVEYRCIWPDGSVHWLSARGRAHHDREGRPQVLEGVAFDVTQRKTADEARRSAEHALLERQAQLGLAIEHAPALIAVFDRDMRYLAASRRWISGFRIEDHRPLVGRSHYEVFPDVPQRWRDIHQRCLAGAAERAEEDAFPRSDGSVDWLRWETLPWRTESGEIGGIIILAELITERKRAEDELRISEERLRLAITGAALGTWHRNVRTGKLVWSALTYSMFGIPSDSPMTYETFLAAIHPEDRARVREIVEHAVRAGSDFDTEYRVCRPDGTQRWFADRGRAFYDAEGRPERIEGIVLDVTPRKQLEHTLREGEARFRNLAEAVPHLVYQLAPSGSLIYANRRWYEYFGRTSLERFEWSQVVHRDDLERVTAAWSEMTRDEYNFEPFRLRRYDGSYHWFVCRSVPVRDAEGRLLHIVGTSTDIEREKKTEEALRESRARLDMALRAAGMGTWVLDYESNRMQVDDALAQLVGLTSLEVQTGSLESLFPLVHPEDREMVLRALSRARDHDGDFEVEGRILRPDGRILWLASKGRAVNDAQGRAVRLFGASVDVTQHRRLEEELRQAQKMEAIGQLAGGVAHDFNNLLTVILGHASIVAMRRDLPPGVGASVHEIESAAERAASLTAQLLAFGRRQVMQFRDVELNEVVANVSAMLNRLVGENIALEVQAAQTGLRVHGDANMLAQVLINLAVNARDAMPSEGRLTIRTSLECVDESARLQVPEAIAGTWACLRVSDTGAGIPPLVLPHIFEPFFTTKDVGKGTGLGLATVYGIVKQHRGWMAVETALGQGTTFKVFLPLAAVNEREPQASTPREQVERGRGELILLVEDERGVRTVTTGILEQHGYRLIAVNDGREALQAFQERGQEIKLLLTDVVMPRGVTGADLVRQLQAQKPSLKAILCSGYSAETVGRGLVSLPQVAFLQKPYRSEQLLSLVRSVLDTTDSAVSLPSA